MFVLSDAAAALGDTFSVPFRTAALKIVAITLALLLATGLALHRWLAGLTALPYPWLSAVLAVVEALGLVAGSVFLVTPASALVAGFFVDDLAADVERRIDPLGTTGRALPVGQAVWISVRFAVLSLGVLLLALTLLLVPGINAVAFLGANAYLSGRQYFEFAALRYRSAGEADALRRTYTGRITAGGLCVALFLSVPLLNLLTPLFATSLMVRMHKRLDPAVAR